MKYKKDTPEYEVNWAIYHEMADAVPMTHSERSHLLKWVKDGNDIDSNPWKYFEMDGSPMNYLKAHRIRFGASHGSWDSWEFEPYLMMDRFGKLTIPN